MEGMDPPASLADLPPGQHYPRPEHGTYPGHVLPGSLFICWGLWWTFSVFRSYLHSSTRVPFKARAWYDVPFCPARVPPLEPLCKVALTFIGMNLETWAGHESYRNMYTSDGLFEVGNLQDWQHAAMYGAFLVSGLVDLISYYTHMLPARTEHAFLALAFLVEGLLFGFHLKGTPLDVEVHVILVMTVLATVVLILAEAAHPGNVLLAIVRPLSVVLQGCWFIQAANILFVDAPQWDPRYMGSVMFAPVVFATYIVGLASAGVAAFVAMRAFYARVLKVRGPAAAYDAVRSLDDEELANGLVDYNAADDLPLPPQVELASHKKRTIS